MQPKNMHTLATICTRYADLHNSALNARKGLQTLKTHLFIDSVNDEEREILKKAQEIVERLQDNHSVHDAIKYYNSL